VLEQQPELVVNSTRLGKLLVGICAAFGTLQSFYHFCSNSVQQTTAMIAICNTQHTKLLSMDLQYLTVVLVTCTSAELNYIFRRSNFSGGIVLDVCRAGFTIVPIVPWEGTLSKRLV